MDKIIEKIGNYRNSIKNEYDLVNANPIAKGAVQGLVTIIDAAIVFLLIWNLFFFFVPTGSWLNIVDGESMSPTMHEGQILFSDNKAVSRGDVITLTLQGIDESGSRKDFALVKRVIGVPGDEIEITIDGVYVNGKLLDEHYLTDISKETTYGDEYKKHIKLDDDEYFVMGDNRSVSYDSRSFGAVSESNILYVQSETPTTTFYLKLILVVLMLAFDIALYMLIEFILTECAYVLFFKKKSADRASGEAALDDNDHNNNGNVVTGTVINSENAEINNQNNV